ncbi:hypothetical protein K5549_008484 [Capra hircus]|nr:hypothetical protein K5549_008484 [Capra hircus]
MVFGLCSQRERLYSLLYAIQIFILTGVVYYYFQGSMGKTAPAHEIAVESSQGSVAVSSSQGLWNMVPRSYEKGVVGSGVPSWGHIPSWTLQVQGPGLKPPLPALSQGLLGREEFHGAKLLCDPAAQRHGVTVRGWRAPKKAQVGRCLIQPIGETLRPVWGPMDKCYPVTTQRRGVRCGKKHDSEAMTPKAMRGSKDAAPKEETAVLSREERQVGAPREEPASLIPGAKRVTEKEEEVAGTPGWQENKKARKETAVYVSEASKEDIVEERPGGWVPQLLRKLWLGWCPASDIPKTRSHE